MIAFFRVKPNPVDANASFKLLRRRKISSFYSIFSFTPRSQFRLLVLGSSQSKIHCWFRKFNCLFMTALKDAMASQFTIIGMCCNKKQCLNYVSEVNIVYKNLPKHYFTFLLRNDSMGLHQLKMALLVPDNSLLHFSKEKYYFIKTYATFFIQDKCCKLLLCLYLMKLNRRIGMFT